VIYLKIDGVDGIVTAKGHEKWIEADSFSFGVGRSAMIETGGGKERSVSKPSISEVTITKQLDLSSPKLFAETCVGTGKKVLVHFVRSSEQLATYLEYELEDCLLTGYSVSGSGSGDPFETISMSFSKIMMKYTPFDKNNKAGNPVPAGYDIQKGVKM
jgi:type VI secretion system secreted protein Hcp